jgi:hypothetical protein
LVVYRDGERSENGVDFDFILVRISLPMVNFLEFLGTYDETMLIWLILRLGLSMEGSVLNRYIFGS